MSRLICWFFGHAWEDYGWRTVVTTPPTDWTTNFVPHRLKEQGRLCLRGHIEFRLSGQADE